MSHGNKGTIVSREKLMEAFPGPISDSFVDESTLSVNVGRLRKSWKQPALRILLPLNSGAGYIIE